MQRENLEQQIARQTIESRTRRHFLQNCATGLGSLWMASQAQAADPPEIDTLNDACKDPKMAKDLIEEFAKDNPPFKKYQRKTLICWATF